MKSFSKNWSSDEFQMEFNDHDEIDLIWSKRNSLWIRFSYNMIMSSSIYDSMTQKSNSIWDRLFMRFNLMILIIMNLNS